MTAARSIGPAIPSGSRSVGGTCTRPGLPLAEIDGVGAGIVPVTSFELTGEVNCGIATCALSSMFGPVLFDCLPIGVGEVNDGAAGIAGAAPESAGAGAGV